MPALRPVPGVMRVVMRGTANGEAIVNVFHVYFGGGMVSQSGADAIVTGVRDAYVTNFLPRINSSYSGDTAYGVDLGGPAGNEATFPISGSGSGAGTTVPNSTACCVTWKIGRHYRGGHPRTYLGPLAATAIEGPTSLAAAFLTSVTSSATAFRLAVQAITVGGTNCQLVCVHRQVDGVTLTTPEISQITGSSVDSRIDTMRRRLGRDR